MSAAVGAIGKLDSSFQVVHDGTHDDEVNVRIKIKDLCSNLGNMELKLQNEL